MDWITLGRALTPDLPIPADQFKERYVRPPQSPCRLIVAQFRSWARREGVSAEGAPQSVFCGARGSGKSTELIATQILLTGEAEVLRLDLSFVLARRSSLAQVLAFVGLAILARLREWENAEGDASRVIGERRTSFQRALEDLGVVIKDIGTLIDALAPLVTAAAPGSAAGVATLATVTKAGGSLLSALTDRVRTPLRPVSDAEQLMRSAAGDELPAARQLVTEVSRLAGALHGLSAKRAIVLIDGLDKGRTLDNLLEIFRDATELFKGLEVPLVLTGPTALRHDPRYAELRSFMRTLVKYNFPVVDREGNRRADGMTAMFEMLDGRLPPALRGAVTDDAREHAARQSSGIPREFFQFLSSAALIAEEEGALRIELAHVREATKTTRLAVQQGITTNDLLLLEQVRRNGRINDTERELLFLDSNVIANYPNDDTYFQPCELLSPWVKQEADRLRRRADD